MTDIHFFIKSHIYATRQCAFQILEDEYDNVEVRIKAYLALVSCASETPGFFRRIEKILDSETVHQGQLGPHFLAANRKVL